MLIERECAVHDLYELLARYRFVKTVIAAIYAVFFGVEDVAVIPGFGGGHIKRLAVFEYLLQAHRQLDRFGACHVALRLEGMLALAVYNTDLVGEVYRVVIPILS